MIKPLLASISLSFLIISSQAVAEDRTEYWVKDRTQEAARDVKANVHDGNVSFQGTASQSEFNFLQSKMNMTVQKQNNAIQSGKQPETNIKSIDYSGIAVHQDAPSGARRAR